MLHYKRTHSEGSEAEVTFCKRILLAPKRQTRPAMVYFGALHACDAVLEVTLNNIAAILAAEAFVLSGQALCGTTGTLLQ